MTLKTPAQQAEEIIPFLDIVLNARLTDNENLRQVWECVKCEKKYVDDNILRYPDSFKIIAVVNPCGCKFQEGEEHSRNRGKYRIIHGAQDSSRVEIVSQLANDIRAEIYRELEEGLGERVDTLPEWTYGYDFARSRALEIVKGKDV